MEMDFKQMIKVQGKIVKQDVLKNTYCKMDNEDYEYHVTLLEKHVGYALLVTLECFNETSLYSYEMGLTKDEALEKYNKIMQLDYK